MSDNLVPGQQLLLLFSTEAGEVRSGQGVLFSHAQDYVLSWNKRERAIGWRVHIEGREPLAVGTLKPWQWRILLFLIRRWLPWVLK